MIIDVRPLALKKNVKRGRQMVPIDTTSVVDEILEDGHRVALCYRYKNANVILMTDISESAKQSITEALATRDRRLEPVDFDDYANRHFVKQPQIGEDYGIS